MKKFIVSRSPTPEKQKPKKRESIVSRNNPNLRSSKVNQFNTIASGNNDQERSLDLEDLEFDNGSVKTNIPIYEQLLQKRRNKNVRK